MDQSPGQLVDAPELPGHDVLNGDLPFLVDHVRQQVQQPVVRDQVTDPVRLALGHPDPQRQDLLLGVNSEMVDGVVHLRDPHE